VDTNREFHFAAKDPKIEPMDRKYQFGISLGVFLLYVLTAARHYVGGDQAIFVTVALDGGYAHAPGYPLYSMYLYATNWGDNPWLATSIATAVLGALAAGVLYRAMLAWGVQSSVAIFGVLIFALAPQVWFYHSKAEVFAGNNLAVAAILWACAPGPSKRPALHVFGLGLLAGLAISHHHTAVFMAPLGLWKTWTLIKDKPQRSLLGLAGLAAGLLPYLWLPYVHIYHYDRWHWGAPGDLDGFFHVFLRKDYGTFTMAATQELSLIPGTQIVFLLKNAATNLLFVLPLLAVAGLAIAWRQQKIPRTPLVALTLSLILAGPLFVSLMHREPVGLDTLLVSKFHQMFLLLLVFLTVFVASLFPKELSPRLLAIVASLLIVIQSTFALDYLTRNQHPAPSYMLHDLWAPLPPNAILLASGDHLTAGNWAYLRATKDSRNTIAPHLLTAPWYEEHIRQTHGINPKVNGLNVDLVSLISDLQAKGHEVFLTSLFADHLAAAFPNHPYGLTIHLLRTGAIPPHPREVTELNAELYEGFLLQSYPNGAGLWGDECASSYADTWGPIVALAQRLEDHSMERTARLFKDKFTH